MKTVQGSQRTEVLAKLERFRSLMKAHSIPAVRLKSVDWFAWATAGGSSVVIYTAEVGVAEVFITETRAWVLTNQIEKDRLASEQVPNEYEIVAFPWEDSKAPERFVHSQLNSATCFSDRPSASEKAMPWDFQVLKMTLDSYEIERYRKVGRQASEAMTDALSRARKDWTEFELAAEGAKELLRRGLDPTLVMVGCENRIQIHRHPISGMSVLGGYAMMVFCARGFGLYANLTRFVFFREPTAAERGKFAQVAQVEATIFAHSQAGQTLPSLYHTLSQAYLDLGKPEEVHRHHQGGPTGYLSREIVASPDTPEHFRLQKGMALAWNPSLPGAKIEDTVLITDTGLEVLTVDPRWPTVPMEGRARPDIWVQKLPI